MTDPWSHILAHLEPRIDNLKKLMEQGPLVNLTIKSCEQGWKLTVDEYYNSELIYIGDESTGSNLDLQINWIAEQLKNWNNVHRETWQDWIFKYQQDIEKFSTIYNLRWGDRT